ncbi:MAG TPA: hypothetical protein VNT30_05060 [Stellaceae bacterium]|nr:hypothetical protein [Stellaceae bacterium]
MVVAALTAGAEVRSTRLTTLVSESENATIAKKAEAAGLSVSAYLRELALGSGAEASDEAAALREFDIMIDRMEGDLDGAIAELSAAISRMDAL